MAMAMAAAPCGRHEAASPAMMLLSGRTRFRRCGRERGGGCCAGGKGAARRVSCACPGCVYGAAGGSRRAGKAAGCGARPLAGGCWALALVRASLEAWRPRPALALWGGGYLSTSTSSGSICGQQRKWGLGGSGSRFGEHVPRPPAWLGLGLGRSLMQVVRGLMSRARPIFPAALQRASRRLAACLPCVERIATLPRPARGVRTPGAPNKQISFSK